MLEVSWLATAVATLSAFVIGGLWYGPVFGPAWMAAVGVSEATLAKGFNPVKIYGLTAVLAALSSLFFACVLAPFGDRGAVFATLLGLGVGVFFVAFSLATNDLFERRSLRLFLINGGYHAVRFAVIGLVFGLLG